MPVTILVQSGRLGSVESAAVAEDRVDWWDDDSSDDDACTESFAAVELRRFLARSLGIGESQIRLGSEQSLPRRGDVFVIGNRRSNRLIASLLGPERRRRGGVGEGHPMDDPGAFHIRALSRGGRSVFVIAGESRVGTLYGVYEILGQLGVRFYGRGDTGTTYAGGHVALPRKLDLEDGPAFRTRGFWAWEPRGNEDFFLWMARNRMNLWTAAENHPELLKKLGIQLAAGGHGIQQEFLDPRAEYPYDHPLWRGDENQPPDPYAVGSEAPKDLDHDGKLSYFEAHPEWFGLHDGKRSPNIHDESGDNYCTSNRDATRELAHNLIRSLAAGRLRHADLVELWMLDGGRWCECERCRLQGTPTDRLLDVAAEVGDSLAGARRDGILKRRVEISVPAYLETLAPPTRPPAEALDPEVCSVTFFPYFRCYAHALADPSCTEINRRLAARYAGWVSGPVSAAVGPLAIGEYYNVSYFASLPLVFPHEMSIDIRWYFRTGARQFYYMHAPTRLWGTWTLDHAVLARLLWDPGTNVDSLVSEFCRCYYPTGADGMRSFYRNLELASTNILAIEHCIGAFGSTAPAGRLTLGEFPVFPLRHLQYEPTHAAEDSAPAWTEVMEAMRRARAEIDRAQRGCSDSLEKPRLSEDERRFAYGEAVFTLYDCLIRTAMCDRAGDDAGARQAFLPAPALAARLRGVHDLVQVASNDANASDGLAASHVGKTFEYYRARYGGPAR